MNATDDPPKRELANAGSGLARYLLLAVLLIIPAWQGAMVLRREFNWDEYYFLTLVFQYRLGTLAQPLQTFHVHLFGWLADLPWSDSDRLVAGRSVMLILHLATLGLLYGLARRLVSPGAAAWAVALYASLQFVLIHAASFRADPLITFLLVGALYLLALRPLRFAALLAAFLAAGLAMLISMKSAIYVPMGAGLLVLQLSRSAAPRRDAGRIAAALVVSGLAITAAFLAHALSLGPPPLAAARDLPAIARTQFGAQGLFSGLRFLVVSMFINAAFYLLAVGGIALALVTVLRGAAPGRSTAAVMLLFASPLLLPALYRNSFPYAYVFLMPPVAVVAGLAASRVQRMAPVVAVLLAVAIAVTLPAFRRSQDGQRQVEAAVHSMFPTAVPYLDRCGMIASFPVAGFFMSTWGLENYLQAGRPVLAEAVARLHPPLLLATHPVFEEALGLEPSAPTGGYALLPEDAAALRDNYVPHWGPVWVAGKRLPAALQEAGFALVIPGAYTFEAATDGQIDGVTVAPGEVVTLAAGRHAYSGPEAILRHGDHLARPQAPAPPPFFLGF